MKEYKKKKNIYATPLRSKATLNKINVLKLFCWDMIYLFLTLFHKILGSLINLETFEKEKKKEKREAWRKSSRLQISSLPTKWLWKSHFFSFVLLAISSIRWELKKKKHFYLFQSIIGVIKLNNSFDHFKIRCDLQINVKCH